MAQLVASEDTINDFIVNQHVIVKLENTSTQTERFLHGMRYLNQSSNRDQSTDLKLVMTNSNQSKTTSTTTSATTTITKIANKTTKIKKRNKNPKKAK